MTRDEHHARAYRHAIDVCRRVCEIDVNALESGTNLSIPFFRKLSLIACDAIMDDGNASEPHNRVADVLDEITEHAARIRELTAELYGVSLAGDQLLRALQGVVTIKPAAEKPGPNVPLKTEKTAADCTEPF